MLLKSWDNVIFSQHGVELSQELTKHHIIMIIKRNNQHINRTILCFLAICLAFNTKYKSANNNEACGEKMHKLRFIKTKKKQ